jgi:GNAT superfamily N-acetyltransferase
VDDQPVWSLTCFFTASDYRRKGVTVFLIREAIDYVRQHGGRILEAYPTVPESDSIPADEGYTGILQVFTRMGFQIVYDKDGSHPIVRYQIV